MKLRENLDNKRIDSPLGAKVSRHTLGTQKILGSIPIIKRQAG